MNYFAHGRCFVDEPYFLAGTAVPDWLNVVNRRAKARSRSAAPFTNDPDPRIAGVARGIMQHHRDDSRFHRTAAFAELNLRFTVATRDLLGAEAGFRPSFLGHILVELLLDWVLIEQAPRRLEEYYRAVDAVDPHLVTRVVDRMATQSVAMLSFWIPRFSAERFLYDYADDERLLYRLNHVMRRVRLPELPPQILDLFPEARQAVQDQAEALLLEVQAS